MGRRKKEHTLDDLFQLLIETPWWMGPVLAVFVFSAFRFLLPWLLTPTDPKDLVQNIPGQVFGGLAYSGAPWLAGVVLFVWGLAELRKFMDRKRFDGQTGITTVRELSWKEFERLLSEAFRRQGYLVEHVGTSGPDGGVDHRLRRDNALTLVQCKHWKKGQVGVAIIRELLGVITSERADGGIVVTSGTFTREAIECADRNAIRLIDGESLLQLIRPLQLIQEVQKQSQPPSDPAENVAPPATIQACPACGSPMTVRAAKKGANAGAKFWGCTRYPACRGTLDIR